MALVFAAPVASRADGTNTLAQSFRATIVGGGVASNGIGLANASHNGGSTSGYIQLSGIPAGASILKAFLYWVVWGGDDPNVNIIDSNHPVTGTLIGRSPDDCWGNSWNDPTTDNRVYRADVTQNVGQNGGYFVSGVGDVPGASGTGASLVVIYGDQSASSQTTIVINDGALTGGTPGDNRNATSHVFSGLGINADVHSASLHIGLGDTQPYATHGDMTLGGSEIFPSTAFGGSDGAWWDDLTGSVPISELSNGTNQRTNTFNGLDDCNIWAYAALTFEQDKGVAPPASLNIGSPANGATLQQNGVTVSGSSSGVASVRLTENGTTLSTTSVDAFGNWSAALSFNDGPHTVTAAGLDGFNVEVVSSSVSFSVQSQQQGGGGPVAITSPENGAVLTQGAVRIEGTATGVPAVQVTEGSQVIGNAFVVGSHWFVDRSFADGGHRVSVTALDSNGHPNGGPSEVQFGVDLTPPTITLWDADFPAPPGSNIAPNVGGIDFRGQASDTLAVARVELSYQQLGSSDPPTIVPANCGACQPHLFCATCGGGMVSWDGHLSTLDTGVYEVTATAYDLANHQATTPTRTVVEIFGSDGPAGLFGPDGPFGGQPPNCIGPLEGSPACFDPFGDGGGPLGIFGGPPPFCIGPLQDALFICKP